MALRLNMVGQMVHALRARMHATLQEPRRSAVMKALRGAGLVAGHAKEQRMQQGKDAMMHQNQQKVIKKRRDVLRWPGML